MIRRREPPYSRLEAIRRSRQELMLLIGTTVVLGLLLGLLSNVAFEALHRLVPTAQKGAIVLGVVMTIGLVLWLAVKFYAHERSQRVFVDLWLPYRLNPDGKFSVPIRRSYQATVYANRALRRRLKKEPAREQELAKAWREARKQRRPLQDVMETECVALVQCLILYVLHRYGEEALGPEAPYGWWEVPLEKKQLAIEDLPPLLRENPYLRADQPPTWRLWWPKDVDWEIMPEPDNPFPRWRFRHRWYGDVELRWHRGLLGGKRGGQTWHILTERLSLSEEEKQEQVFLIGARMEATAHFRWTILRRSELFHDWATGLLAFLEEALDWDYFLATRPQRLLADLAWKVGWVAKGSSLMDALQEILGRLEHLEVEQAMVALPSEEKGKPLVV